MHLKSIDKKNCAVARKNTEKAKITCIKYKSDSTNVIFENLTLLLLRLNSFKNLNLPMAPTAVARNLLHETVKGEITHQYPN